MLFDGPEDARHTIVLAHGAGAAMDSPYMETMAAGLAARGIRIVRFEFAYMAARRADGKRRGPDREPVLRIAWKGVVEKLGGGEGLVIGGKSMGGRMASLVADEVSARGLLCLGYPFHPPGRPERLRTAHLEQLYRPGHPRSPRKAGRGRGLYAQPTHLGRLDRGRRPRPQAAQEVGSHPRAESHRGDRSRRALRRGPVS